MKRVLVFLISLFMFINVAYADSMYCYIGKESNENVILKSNDEIKVFFNSSFDGTELINAKYQLYYDPYIFEIVKNDEEYVYHSGNFEIKNVKIYSSIIEFEVIGNNNIYENHDIYVKFKVKQSVKKGESTIELIGNNSSVNHLLTYQVDNEEKSIEEKVNCINSKLFYIIDDETKDKNDAYLSFLDIDSEDGYLTPGFSPNRFEYNVYLYNSNSTIGLFTICAVDGCMEDYTNLGQLKSDKTIYLETKNGNSTEKYKVNFMVQEDNYEYPKLKYLKVLKYNMIEEFDEYDYTYHVNIPETENSLLIDYESDYDVKIEGNENFEMGENIVTITVYDGQIHNRYYLIVQKQEKEVLEPLIIDDELKEEIKESTNKEESLMSQNIITGLILLAMIISILVIIIKDKQ